MPNDVFLRRSDLNRFEINDPRELGSWTLWMAAAGALLSLSFILAFVR
jgi:hypothetical protein